MPSWYHINKTANKKYRAGYIRAPTDNMYISDWMLTTEMSSIR